MTQRFIIPSLLMFFLAFASSVQAQNKVKMQLGYNVAIPTSAFKSDFIDQTSFNGFTGAITYAFSPKFSAGLQSGFQSYYQKYNRAVYKLEGNQSVSAVLSNQLEVIPVMLRGTFFPLGGTPGRIQPYLSAGAGINLVSYTQYVGEFGSADASVPFAAETGAGVYIPFGNVSSGKAFTIGGSWSLVNYKRNGIANLNHFGINAGISFPIK